jgi:hypothetical protein
VQLKERFSDCYCDFTQYSLEHTALVSKKRNIFATSKINKIQDKTVLELLIAQKVNVSDEVMISYRKQ